MGKRSAATILWIRRWLRWRLETFGSWIDGARGRPESGRVIDPGRVLRELRELRDLTSDAEGAQRVAFTPVWQLARDWFRGKLAELSVEVHQDAAGNVWATLPGRESRAVVIGGHLDSVPGGGWLDGSLNLLAGLEVLRGLKREFGVDLPFSVRLVDWADEEGARFGKSLFGSSACSGNLDLGEVRGLVDQNGVSLVEALRKVGLELERVLEAGRELREVGAYLELHIEQGPVLLDAGLSLGAVLGTYGVERHAFTFEGQPAHSGSTPMNRRRDAWLAAARMAPEMYEICRRRGGVATIGSCQTWPGIVTSVVGRCRITLDLRHLEGETLAGMLTEAEAAAARFAREGNVAFARQRLLRIEPVHFHPELIDLAEAAIVEVCGCCLRLPSGPLHDASEMARAGIPTGMLFVQSLHGISHNRMEDSREEDLELAVRALHRLTVKTLDWLGRAG